MKMHTVWTRLHSLVAVFLIGFSVVSYSDEPPFLIGAGIYDITGAAAEINMMGYAQSQQLTSGIHSRLWSRAFIIASTADNKRVVFVSADLGMVFQSVKQGVVRRLKEEFGSLYNDKNLMISATHTHAGPGGYAFETLYNFTVRGFYKDNYEVVVEGITQSIIRAHRNLEPGSILFAEDELTNTSKNRSIKAYLKNPQVEREQYEHDTDKSFSVLKLVNQQQQPIGLINWHAVHPVSMSNTNTLISGDNKGYAAYLFEKDWHTNYRHEKTFVAAFAQANEGDISPNIFDTEAQGHCEAMTCVDIQHTYTIGKRQYKKAKELFAKAHEAVGYGVDYRHQYLDMAHTTVDNEFTHAGIQQTCQAALGYSFGAGTLDGVGLAFLFSQGQLNSDPFVNLVRNIVAKPSHELVECQKPKPILLAVGLNKPAWVPHNMPVQIFKIGNLVIAGVPAELTTMAGRRVKNLIKEAFQGDVTHVVIAGLSNSYAGYVTTPEEYTQQNYEGGFTVFGQWTLPAYLQGFKRLVDDMRAGRETDTGPIPEDLSTNTASLILPVLFDDKWPSVAFGTVHQQPNSEYQRGEIAHASFWAGHPRNNLETMSGFLTIQHLLPDGTWTTVAHDWDFETTYYWERIGVSYAYGHVYWKIPNDTPEGTYRITHSGHYKFGWNQKIYPYEGVSSPFTVIR